MECGISDDIDSWLPSLQPKDSSPTDSKLYVGRKAFEATLEIIRRKRNVTIQLNDEVPLLISTKWIARIKGLNDAPACRS